MGLSWLKHMYERWPLGFIHTSSSNTGSLILLIYCRFFVRLTSLRFGRGILVNIDWSKVRGDVWRRCLEAMQVRAEEHRRLGGVF